MEVGHHYGILEKRFSGILNLRKFELILIQILDNFPCRNMKDMKKRANCCIKELMEYPVEEGSIFVDICNNKSHPYNIISDLINWIVTFNNKSYINKIKSPYDLDDDGRDDLINFMNDGATKISKFNVLITYIIRYKYESNAFRKIIGLLYGCDYNHLLSRIFMEIYNAYINIRKSKKNELNNIALVADRLRMTCLKYF